MNNYIFPFSQIPFKSKIILYGAGTVGLCFYKQVKTSKYADIVLWVDLNWRQKKKDKMPVESVENILNVLYDYVVIALDNNTVAMEIRHSLIEMGIKAEKIIYFENSRFIDTGLYENVFEEYQELMYTEELTKIKPGRLLNKNRLDLAVRYLVAKDLINGVENEKNLSLYSRMILCRSGANEGMYYFQENTRCGAKEYIESMKKICLSMRKEGFKQDHFVPIGENGILLNGAHRTAVALALEEEVWVRYYEGQLGNIDFNEGWFDQNGFNWEDKLRIFRAYADLYENCGIMLLFGPCIEQWNYLQAQISKEMSIVGAVELDFTDNYIAFENLFREIYLDPLWRNVYIDRKVELLKMAPLKIRVILVSDEEFKKQDLYRTMTKVKEELRNRMFYDTDIAPIVMHGSDSKEEFEHLKQIFLSVNNQKYLRMRLARNYSEDFIARLDKLKDSLKYKGICQQDIAVSGSSGWEILGLRQANDLDFFVSNKYRRQFGIYVKPWEDGLEYVRLNSFEISNDTIYEDDLLISDDNFHYVFYGIKFVNIDIIAAKKRFNAREKDLRDVRLYELFQDFVFNFNNKECLKKQIEKEFYKKR